MLVLRTAPVLGLAPAGAPQQVAACVMQYAGMLWVRAGQGAAATGWEGNSTEPAWLPLAAWRSRVARVLLACGAASALMVQLLTLTNHATIISDEPSARQERQGGSQCETVTAAARAAATVRRSRLRAAFGDHLPDAVLLQSWDVCWRSLRQQRQGKRLVFTPRRLLLSSAVDRHAIKLTGGHTCPAVAPPRRPRGGPAKRPEAAPQEASAS